MANPSDIAPSLPASPNRLFRFGIVGSYAGTRGPSVSASALAKRAANDDDGSGIGRKAGLFRAEPVSDQTLQAALRYFAEHGLGAARAARAQAEKAFFLGDRQAYDWWIGITRTLDRRLAAEAERAANPV